MFGLHILCVGTTGDYIELATCLDPYLLAESQANLQVLAVGSDKFGASEFVPIMEFGLVERVIQKKFPDQDLVEVYRICFSRVATSYFEGFDLPVIENMSHRKLVITNDIPVLNETAGGTFTFIRSGRL